MNIEFADKEFLRKDLTYLEAPASLEVLEKRSIKTVIPSVVKALFLVATPLGRIGDISTPAPPRLFEICAILSSDLQIPP